jgi:hypothetical protein
MDEIFSQTHKPEDFLILWLGQGMLVLNIMGIYFIQFCSLRNLISLQFKGVLIIYNLKNVIY